jgi:hypothetical protein
MRNYIYVKKLLYINSLRYMYALFVIIIITLSLHIKTHNLRFTDGFPDCQTWQ